MSYLDRMEEYAKLHLCDPDNLVKKHLLRLISLIREAPGCPYIKTHNPLAVAVLHDKYRCPWCQWAAKRDRGPEEIDE